MKKVTLLTNLFVLLLGIFCNSFVAAAQNTTINYYQEKYFDRNGTSHEASPGVLQECTFSGEWLSTVLTTTVRSEWALKYKFHHNENGYMVYYLWVCVRPFSAEHRYDYTHAIVVSPDYETYNEIYFKHSGERGTTYVYKRVKEGNTGTFYE